MVYGLRDDVAHASVISCDTIVALLSWKESFSIILYSSSSFLHSFVHSSARSHISGCVRSLSPLANSIAELGIGTWGRVHAQLLLIHPQFCPKIKHPHSVNMYLINMWLIQRTYWVINRVAGVLFVLCGHRGRPEGCRGRPSVRWPPRRSVPGPHGTMGGCQSFFRSACIARGTRPIITHSPAQISIQTQILWLNELVMYAITWFATTSKFNSANKRGKIVGMVKIWLVLYCQDWSLGFPYFRYFFVHFPLFFPLSSFMNIFHLCTQICILFYFVLTVM